MEQEQKIEEVKENGIDIKAKKCCNGKKIVRCILVLLLVTTMVGAVFIL